MDIYVVLLMCMAAVAFGGYILSDKTKLPAYVGGLLVATGILLAGGMYGVAGERVNDIFKAASTQGLVIQAEPITLRPYAVEPCEVRLRLKSSPDGGLPVLMLHGADAVVTPEMIQAVCARP